ncbi:putative aquaporin 4 [Gymnopus androsaceus JB14]|uniref:Aquaporin 4 n=1 Tax=Gymnopus androsaceus JB14 TaxID=1447944 RepID=A0A6A4HAZ9_9AGAR|nr:putative aquaporin 4 [Gymnopus androsaceus JB14]
MPDARASSPTSSVEHMIPRDVSTPQNFNNVPHSKETFHHVPEPEMMFIEQNGWFRIRQKIREPAAEFAGVMLLVIFGCGVNCQVNLSSNTGVSATPKGDYTSVCFGWAAGIALAVWVSAGISGGHINPAVTLSLAVFRGFPWRKVPVFIFAQLLGGIVGAAIVYANYFHAIDIVEGGRGVRTLATAGNFGTFAAGFETNVSAFFSEFLITAILLIVILAATDKRNSPPPYGLLPLVLFILLLGISASLGIDTGFGANPARDLGPRILTSMVGYGSQVYTFRNQYWIWCPILAPILGGLTGTMLYDTLIFIGEESLVNRVGSTYPVLLEGRHDDIV